MNRFFPVCLLFTITAFGQQDSAKLLQQVVIQGNRIQTGFDETAAHVVVLKANEVT